MSSVIVLSGILTMILLIRGSYSEKTIELVKAQPIANSDSNVIDFGSLRVTKQSKQSKNLTISGTFKIKEDLQEEEFGYSVYRKEMHSKEFSVTPILQNYNTICIFIMEDNTFYPGLKKASNVPEQGTCPFPKGSYTIKDYAIHVEILETLQPGEYKLMLMQKRMGKFVAGYEVYVTIKA